MISAAALTVALAPGSSRASEPAAARHDWVSWRSTIGTHYRLDVERWMGVTRDYPQGNVGFRNPLAESR
jgi:hypothetical protein